VGLPYYSDPDHCTEYDPEGFRAELEEACLGGVKAADHVEHLETEVAAGHFRSIEDAVRWLADFKAINTDGLAWARPYVESARDAAARGEVLTLDEHRARMAARLEAAKGA
jgi:antitoxin ParD1/3/4